MRETFVDPSITPEVITTLDLVEDVRLSPDGSKVAFVCRKRNRSDDGYEETLLLFDCDCEQLIPLTASAVRPSEPRWSHNGQWLAYFTEHKKQKNIWIRKENGENVLLLHVPKSAEQLEWSVDGQWISCIVEVEPSSEREDSPIIVARESRKRKQLWLIAVETGKVHVLVDDVYLKKYAWAPNSREIVGVIEQDDEEVLVIYSLEKTPILFAKVHDSTITVAWSPDGKTIAWCGREHAPNSGQIMVFRTDSNGLQTPQTLLPHFPGSIKWLDFLPDGRIIFAALKSFRVGIFCVAIDGTDLRELFSPERTKPGSLGSGSFSQFHVSISRDGNRFATTRSGPKEPSNVVLGEWGKPLRQLTHLNPQANDWSLAEAEEVTWEAKDGLKIEGLLIKPPHFTSSQSYPLIVELHGGPRRSWWDTCYLVQSWAGLLANQGYLVLLPNPRGSSGRGAYFVRANQSDLGGSDFDDVMQGIDNLIALGMVNPQRLGICGWSYGGYLTAWGITQTSRFRAAVMGAAMVNWMSWEGQTSMFGIWPTIHWRDRLIAYHDPQTLMERSPIYHVKKVVTPTLIVHGTHDQKVPFMQAEEFYRALKALGQQVSYVKYVGEGHGIVRKSNQIDLMKRVIQWFHQHLSATHS